MTKQLRNAIALVLFMVGGSLILNGLNTPSRLSVSALSTSVSMDFSGMIAASILIGAVFIIGGLGVLILITPKPDEK